MLTLLLAACATVNGTPADVSADHTYRADVWSDNWFAMYIGDELVIEDSVPITTERSFNAESFGFDADHGAVLSFILKDFKANDSGLEYIGQGNQQMGDGGFIVQVTDQSTGEVVLVSSRAWKCLPIHQAPLNKECASSSNPEVDCQFTKIDEPVGWKSPTFDDQSWSAATEHTKAAVSPKQGYNEISWNESATFIWGPDLQSDNTVLCRVTLP